MNKSNASPSFLTELDMVTFNNLHVLVHITERNHKSICWSPDQVITPTFVKGIKQRFALFSCLATHMSLKARFKQR